MVTLRRVIAVIKTPLTLLVLVGLLVFGGWWGMKALTTPLPSPPPTPCVSRDVGAYLTSENVTVNVYNGGNQRGLAGEVAAALQDKHFIISKVDNSKDRNDHTIIKGASKDAPEVKLVAGFFNGATIQEDGRVDHTVDVYVGAEWAADSIKLDAPTQIPVPGKVCLPAPKTPSATSAPVPSAKKS